MTFTGPIPFDEAFAIGRNKHLLPMDLTSEDYAVLEQELKQRAVFSATMDKASVLQVLLDNLTLLVAGTEDEHGRIRSIPEAKAQLRESMLRAGVPLAPMGTSRIKDFYSDARRSLMIETNVLDTLGFGGWKRQQSRVSLDVNPGLELVRLRWPKGGVAAMRPWLRRWASARDAIGDAANHGCTDPGLHGGRMVALKNHPIWQALGSGAGGYGDALGNPWPPFAFRSGMGVEPVPREECIEMGLVSKNQQIEPDDSFDLNDSLQASTARFNEALQRELDRGGLRVVDGVLKVGNAAPINRIRELLLALNARAMNAYNPAQSRVPSGQPGGGEFAPKGLLLALQKGKLISHGKLGKSIGGHEGGIAAATSPSNAGGGQGSGGTAHGSESDVARLAREQGVLRGLSHGTYELRPRRTRFLAQGSEHYVEHHADPSRVRKFTTSGYGNILKGHAAPFGHYATLREATPSEYIERLRLHNEVFHTENRIEGVFTQTSRPEGPSLVTSQPFRRGSTPTEEEVPAAMKAQGFKPVSEANIANDYLAQKTWYNPHSKIIASDVKPENFVKDDQNRLVPLDLIVMRPAPGSHLARAMEEGIRAANARLKVKALLLAVNARNRTRQLQEAA